MELFLIVGWVMLSLVAATIGSDRKIGGVMAFIVALIFSPLAGIAIAFASKRKEDEAHEKKIEELLSEINNSLKK